MRCTGGAERRVAQQAQSSKQQQSPGYSGPFFLRDEVSTNILRTEILSTQKLTDSPILPAFETFHFQETAGCGGGNSCASSPFRVVCAPRKMPPVGRKDDAPRFKTLDKDESRRGREETTISLRKDKRAEQLQKKRFGASSVPMAGSPDNQSQSVGSQAWLEANPTALVEGVHSDDPNLQLPAVTQFRKLLSIERSPPIEEVIAAGVVPRFVQFLQVLPAAHPLSSCASPAPLDCAPAYTLYRIVIPLTSDDTHTITGRTHQEITTAKLHGGRTRPSSRPDPLFSHQSRRS